MISTVDFIAAQLRAAAPDGDWNAKGVDRAIELAAMFQRAGFRTLETLSIEPVDIWECFALIGNGADIRNQAEYDSLPRVSPTHKPVTSSSERSRLMFDFARSPWRFSDRWPALNDPGVGWYDEFGNLRTPQQVLERRDYLPLRFANPKIGYLGDTHRDATINGEKPLLKIWQGMANLGWSSRGDGHVYYLITLSANNQIAFIPVWQSSSASDKALAKELAAVAITMVSIGYAFAGAGSLGTAVGEKIVGTQFAAANPTLTKIVGNAALNTAMNGGDVEQAVKNSARSVGATALGVNVGGQVSAVTGLDAAGRVASAVTTAYIRGGDVDKAATFALVQSIPDFFPSENQQMDWLSISSGNVGEPDVWGISAMPGVVSPESTLPGFTVASLPSLADTFSSADEAGLWDRTRDWFSTTFTRENIRAAQDLTAGAVGIIKTVRSLDPNAPQPRAAAQQTQTIRNPDGSITRVAPDGTVQVITAEQVRQMQGGGGFNLSPQMLAIGGAAVVALFLLSRRR